jgi:hypothetical protein
VGRSDLKHIMDAFVLKKKVSGENRLTMILEQEKEIAI